MDWPANNATSESIRAPRLCALMHPQDSVEKRLILHLQQGELEMDPSVREQGGFLRLIDLHQNDIERDLKGFSMTTVGAI